ncbi:MAG: signal peptidase I [Verrucomicrobiota bacterium]
MFSSKEKKLRKVARHMLGHAHKVVAYRRDLLKPEALDEIEDARGKLEKELKDKVEIKTIEKSIDTLEKTLKRHGGKIFPMTFMSENVEMILVAAILAIGVRTYFFQPFKIPTNSMWPTYAGLNATVYPPSEPRPNIVKRFFLGATQGLPQSLPFGIAGQFNYYLTAPKDGELVVRLGVIRDELGWNTNVDFADTVKPLFGNLGSSPKRVYSFDVGGERTPIVVPGDFEFNEVLLESWFPEYDSLNDVFEHYRRLGKIRELEPRRASNGRSRWQVVEIETGIQLKQGQTVFDFDINSGDMLFVDRFSYNFVRPDVGDPVVFRTDNIPGLRAMDPMSRQIVDDERYYIKRLVGVEGDTLEIKGPVLYSNGEPIEGADAFGYNAELAPGYLGYQNRWKLGEGDTDTVPAGYFYTLGDNSPHSFDSRGWGVAGDFRTMEERAENVPVNMVPEKDVVGRASFIFYPFTKRWGPAE